VQCCSDAGVFIIASRRPLNFDSVTAGGHWQDFPLLNADNSNIVRALGEFVTRVAGNDPSTYTVRYASAADGLQWDLKTWDTQHASVRGR
jgi:hypothetical protein